jgi:hypothetical protein
MFGNAPDPITFHEISLLMAREPEGRMAEDQVLGELVSAFWRGEFEDEHGTSCVFRLNPPSGVLTDSDGLWVRDGIGDKAPDILCPNGERAEQTRVSIVQILPVTEDNFPQVLRHADPLHVFQILSKWKLSQFGEVTRVAYFEPLTIAIDDLQKWFLNKEWEPPTFIAGDRVPKNPDGNETRCVEPPVKLSRPNTIENQAKQGNTYQEIINYARRKWKTSKAPSFKYMAGQICINRKNFGLGEETIRKLLAGHYGPARKMRISGY